MWLAAQSVRTRGDIERGQGKLVHVFSQWGKKEPPPINVRLSENKKLASVGLRRRDESIVSKYSQRGIFTKMSLSNMKAHL